MVDDNPDLVAGTTTILSEASDEVRSALNGGGALLVWSAEAVDGVLVDAGMQAMNLCVPGDES
jgi:CheY-like chemotaxis protein